ncbi:MAG: hypothetical protein WBW37_07570 [Methyloceanibacter sp.]
MLFAGGMLIYFGLPDGGRIAQATLQRRQRVQHGAGGGRPARIAGGRRARTLYRGGESVAETRGRRPWVPERQLTKPTLPPGQAYAKDQGSAEDDDADNRRFDGNPDE